MTHDEQVVHLVHLRHSGRPREPARDKTGRLCASLPAALAYKGAGS
jgi:hypothetical protein